MKTLKYGSKAARERFLWLVALLSAPLFSSFYDDGFEPQNNAPFTVVLDAGHGGHDPGNLGNGYFEKNIALNIVLKAGALLEQNPDIKVIYTRKDDTFVDLYVRGEIANKAGADLFVSVHCDSHTSQAHGAGTFVLGLHANKQNFEIAKKENSVIYLEDDYKDRYADYDINSPESVIGLTIMQEEFLDQSIALAKNIQDNFVTADRKDRKVKQAGFIVLHQTVMPSVLVETGFLTNKEEGAYLDSKKGQSQMGEAIGKAILNYKENVMANRADFDPVAMTEAPDPEDAGKEAAKKEAVGKESAEREAADQESVGKGVGVEEDVNRKLAGKGDAGREGASNGTDTSDIVDVSESEDAGRLDASNTTRTSTTANVSEAIPEEVPAEVIVSARPQPVERTTDPEKAEKTSSPDEAPRIMYKVQIMASAKDLPLRPASFNGLSRVTKEPFNNLYRYVYGSTSSLREAEMLKSNADIKGYPSSFIVVYRDGQRITFKESKQFLSKQ